MATQTRILSPQETNTRQFDTGKSRDGFFRRFFAPVALQKPMSEKDIKQYLYPKSGLNIECRIVSSDEKA